MSDILDTIRKAKRKIENTHPEWPMGTAGYVRSQAEIDQLKAFLTAPLHSVPSPTVFYKEPSLAKLHGIEIYTDPDMATGEMEIRDLDGKALARITGLGQ